VQPFTNVSEHQRILKISEYIIAQLSSIIRRIGDLSSKTDADTFGLNLVGPDMADTDMAGIDNEDKVDASVIHHDDIQCDQVQGTIRARY
jgi:hypothetical protein